MKRLRKGLLVVMWGLLSVFPLGLFGQEDEEEEIRATYEDADYDEVTTERILQESQPVEREFTEAEESNALLRAQEAAKRGKEFYGPNPPLEPIEIHPEYLYWSVGLAFQDMTIRDKAYFVARILPAIGYEDFSMGLDLSFIFDAEGNFNTWDWTTALGLVSKIEYMRYGGVSDSWSIAMEDIVEYGLGYGMIMERFNNTYASPYLKNKGANTRLDMKYGGGLIMLDNVVEANILASRVYFTPFADFDNYAVRSIKIGGNFAVDFAPASYMTTDNPYEMEHDYSDPAVFLGSGDISIRAVELDLFTMDTFLEVGGITGGGTAESFGMMGRIANALLYRFQLDFGQNLEPYYFGPFYYANRSTRYETATDNPHYIGYRAELGVAAYADQLILMFAAAGPFDGSSGQTISTDLILTQSLLQYVSLRLSRMRANVYTTDDWLSYEPGEAGLGIEMRGYFLPTASMGLLYKSSYWLQGEGPEGTSEFQVIDIDVEIAF